MSNDLTVLDGETQEVVGSIPVCGRPRDIAWSPDRSTIYVACATSNAVGMVDVAKGEMTGTTLYRGAGGLRPRPGRTLSLRLE